MSKDMWSQLNRYSDGEGLNAEVLNVPIGQLGDRTEYLYARLKRLMGSGAFSSVILTDVRLSTDPGKVPEVGNAVYYVKEKDWFAPAKATMSLYDDFKAADSAFSVGILSRRDGTVGDVVIYGKMVLGSGGPVYASDVIESKESFRPGRYYLSANERGKLTANPTGPLIYVCTISGEVAPAANAFSQSSFALVTPQFLDIGTSHVHRTAVLTARPAGELSSDGKSVLGYLPTAGGPLAIVFGGTWTATGEKVYEFRTSEDSVAWQSGVKLVVWEDGRQLPDQVVFYAPGVEKPIANGLTATLMEVEPDSSSSSSSFQDSLSGLHWEGMTFPGDGRGWINHRPCAIAEDPSSTFRVEVAGRVDACPTTVNVAIPGDSYTFDVSSDGDDVEVTYEGVTFRFTDDVDAYSGTGVGVQRGPCVADSALNLAKALSKVESQAYSNPRFAVFSDSADGSSAKLVSVGSGTVGGLGDATEYMSTQMNAADPDSSAGVVVVYDGEGRILGDSAVVQDVHPYQWVDIGDLSLFLYREGDLSEVYVGGKTVSATMLDYEPDAVYDYVLGMDAQVSNHWPPVPPKSAALLVNGVEMDNKALLPDNPTVSFARDTIHWFEDDAGRRPWPDAFVSRGAEIDPADDKTQVLHWVKSFQGATGPVTSLQTREGSPIRILGYGTEDYANTGDLEIVADFDFEMRGTGVPGYNVPKRARNGKLLAGPVVEKIVGGAGISVISRPGHPQGQGVVTVGLDDAYRSQFGDIALENAEQAKIGMFPYIRLKGYSTSLTSPSAFTATMRVPTSLPSGSYVLGLQATVFGEANFTEASQRWACVKLAYNILPDYDAGSWKYNNLKTGLLKPDFERTVLIPFGHESDGGFTYGGFDPIVVATEQEGTEENDVLKFALGKPVPFRSEFAQQGIVPELRPGYLVGIRFSRAVTSDPGKVPYTGALGFINLSWTLE